MAEELTLTEYLLSLDPGAPHVGVALWVFDGERWHCQKAKEVTPDEFSELADRVIAEGQVSRVAYEIYRLGGGQEALYQRGSTFGAVEVIGVARRASEVGGTTFEGFERGVRKSALTRMRAVGWKFPKGAPTHVKDAIAVGACAIGWRAADHVDGDGIGT